MIRSLTKLTNRKFYNKWLYKVTIDINGGNLMRSNDMAYIAAVCLTSERSDRVWGWNSRSYEDRTDLHKLSTYLASKDKDSWSKRVERNFVDFYTNDEILFDELSDLLPHRIKHRFAPENQTQDILNDSVANLAVKKYPHDRYQHKVYLLPHKMKNDKEAKRKYIDWLKKQMPKVTCTPAIEKWFISTDWNWDRRYILVEDESMLLMMKLRNSEVVGRVYNYVLYDK